MRTKKPVAMRLSDDAIEALEAESNRTGKPKVAVVEDALTWNRVFGDEAQTLVNALAKKHHLSPRKVVEFCVLKAAGAGGKLPFEHLMAA